MSNLLVLVLLCCISSAIGRLIVYDTVSDLRDKLFHELPVVEKYYETEAEVLRLQNGENIGPAKGLAVYKAHDPAHGFYHVRLRPDGGEPIWNATDVVQILIRYASHTNFAVWGCGSPVAFPPLPSVGPHLINWRTEVFPNCNNWYFNLEAIIGETGFLILDQVVVGVNEPPFPIEHELIAEF